MCKFHSKKATNMDLYSVHQEINTAPSLLSNETMVSIWSELSLLSIENMVSIRSKKGQWLYLNGLSIVRICSFISIVHTCSFYYCVHVLCSQGEVCSHVTAV